MISTGTQRQEHAGAFRSCNAALVVFKSMRFPGLSYPMRFVLTHFLALGLVFSVFAPGVTACPAQNSWRTFNSLSHCSHLANRPSHKAAPARCCKMPGCQGCKIACCCTSPVRQPATPPARSTNPERLVLTWAVSSLPAMHGVEQGLASTPGVVSFSCGFSAAITLQLAHVRIQT